MDETECGVLMTCDLTDSGYLLCMMWWGVQNCLRVVGCVQGVMDGVPASKDYKGGFACKLMHKDLGLASAAAQHCGAQVPMSTEAARLYKKVTTACCLHLVSVILHCILDMRDH